MAEKMTEKEFQEYRRKAEAIPFSKYAQMCALLRHKQVMRGSYEMDKWEFFYSFKDPLSAAELLNAEKLRGYSLRRKAGRRMRYDR